MRWGDSSALRQKASAGSWFLSNVGAQVVGAICGMVTNILYARMMDLSSVGAVALSHSLAISFTVLFDRGLGTWVTREMRKECISVKQCFHIMMIAALPAFALLCGFCALSFLLASVRESSWYAPILWSLPLTVCYWLFQATLSISQGVIMPHLRSALLLSNGLFTVILTFFALLVVPTPLSAVAATAVAYAAVAVFGFLWLSRHYIMSQVPISGQLRRQAVRQSRKLFATNVAVFSLSAGDVIVASLCMPGGQVGIYQLVKKVSQGLILPILSVLPVVLGRMNGRSDASIASYFQKIIFLSIAYIAALSIAGFLGFPFLLGLLFGEELVQWNYVAVLLVFAFGMQLLKDSMAAYFNSVRRDFIPVSINCVVVVVFFGTSIILGSVLGLMGFAVLMGASFSLGFFLSVLLAWKSSVWSLRAVGGVLVCCGALAVTVVGLGLAS